MAVNQTDNNPNTQLYAWAHGWLSLSQREVEVSLSNISQDKTFSSGSYSWANNYRQWSDVDPWDSAKATHFLRESWVDNYVVVNRTKFIVGTSYFNSAIVRETYQTLGWPAPSTADLLIAVGNIWTDDYLYSPVRSSWGGAVDARTYTASQNQRIASAITSLYIETQNTQMPKHIIPPMFVDADTIDGDEEDFFQGRAKVVIDLGIAL